jgi:hypothetical protein
MPFRTTNSGSPIIDGNYNQPEGATIGLTFTNFNTGATVYSLGGFDTGSGHYHEDLDLAFNTIYEVSIFAQVSSATSTSANLDPTFSGDGLEILFSPGVEMALQAPFPSPRRGP